MILSTRMARRYAAVLAVSLFCAGAAVAATDGRAIYERHCSRCHQPDGSGVAQHYPDLHDLAAEGAARRDLIRGVLAGRSGARDDGPERRRVIMPTHGYLGNETIAAALSYVIARWSDAGEPVTTDEVAAERLALLTGHGRGASDPAAGASPLTELDATQYLTSDGPAMTVDEFERARRLYYGRCTGCHGVLRHGTAGNPLTVELMRALGTEYLQSVIAFGASGGMPGWGSEGDLSGADINLLARFLQHPVPQPPDMDPYDVRDGWQQIRTPAERPGTPRHDYDLDALFVVFLHDVGEIALIDGASKTIVGRADVGRAPHRVAASESGRYLYVIGRDGTVSQVDLYAAPPQRVASVRIGFEARAIAASRGADGEGVVLAGAFWPPQFVLLDGRTLEPLRQLSTRSAPARAPQATSGVAMGQHPEPRVSDIVASPYHPEFLGQIKETGQIMLVPYDGGALPRVDVLQSAPELRAGSTSLDGRYHLTPTDGNAISVVDFETREVVAQVPARVYGGNPGTAYRHERFGPVWGTTSMADQGVLLVGTDPVDHPAEAWQVVERGVGPASGSLFLSTHPQSGHLWMDTPLAADPQHSQGVAVFDKHALEDGFRHLPVAAWSGLEAGPRRVLQPTYSADGAEVWLAVWNPQTRGSAIVVVDDASLEPIATIRTPELITATRIYSVAALRAASRRAAGSARAAPSGADLYASHCANCHGRYGEGDGPVAPDLATAPKDLRYLSARNDGAFPQAFVREIIDGRRMRPAHGPEDMPVWGAELRRASAGDASESQADAAIDAMVRFLEAIQVSRQ